jgi:D-inositol-3-phosphate glycosyltransferase
MKSGKKSRIATLMVHTSPLDQAGIGDAGGMNVYVVETAKKMAAAGVAVEQINQICQRQLRLQMG